MAEGSLAQAQAAALAFTKNHILSGTAWRGIGELPRKIDGGFPYTGVNIPALLGQLPMTSTPAIFGTTFQWGQRNLRVKKGSKGLGFIYMKSFKSKDKPVDLKEQEEELEVTDNGRIIVPVVSFGAFAQCQIDGYDADSAHPILEDLKRQRMDERALIASGKRAIDAGERYMTDWMQSPNAARRPMGEGERQLIVHLAADLVMGYNAGSMQLAGELNTPYPSGAQNILDLMKPKDIMRPWGIACDILRQLSPVFDANVKAGAEAATAAQEAYRKRVAKAAGDEPSKAPVPILDTPAPAGSGEDTSTAADGQRVNFSSDW